MNTESNTPLERELAMLTEWSGESPELWRGAISASATPSANNAAAKYRSPFRGVPSRRFVTVAAAAIGILVLLPTLNYLGSGLAYQRTGAKSASPHLIGKYLTEAKSPADQSLAAPEVYSNDNRESTLTLYSVRGQEGRGADATARKVDSIGYGGFVPSEPSVSVAKPTPINQSRAGERSVESRLVIRKATIELRTRDVRAVFAKAAQLISEAGGEFVQDSSLTGNDDRLQANLTLRVAAERLSTVLQALRELGEVKSEAAGGEDVTSQVVDLEARLTNERRVEQELLQLLESRKDAPLKEILELRTAIDSVRQSIETMTAQRERLGRLVSLATVLVLIRTPDAPDKPVNEGLAAYFGNALQHAALRGVRALIDTLAGLTLVLIGGGIWILLAIIAVWFGWRALRRQSAN